MKKALSLFLALVMALSLAACGGSSAAEEKETPTAAGEPPAVEETAEISTYTVGETAETDILALTLDWAQLSIALENTWGDDYFTPKEYDAAEDANNPYVAAKGHTLVSIIYTVSNLDRASVDFDGSFNPTFITVEYQGASASETKYGAEGIANEYGLNEWSQYNSSNVLLQAGETCTYKCYCDIAVDAADLTDSFRITFSMPNSDGTTTDAVFTVDSEGLAAAKAQQDALEAEAAAAKEAALAEALAEIDPGIASEIKAILQGEWEYTANNIRYDLLFDGDYISVTSTVAGYSLANEGTYSIRRDYILIDYNTGAQARIPYTYTDGNLNMSYLEGLD